MKTLNQYWTLEDEEFTLTVVSPLNLSDEYYNQRMTEVLERYDLRSLTLSKIETMVTHPPQFPGLPYGTLHYYEAIVGIPVNYDHVKKDLAAWLKVQASSIFVSEDGTVKVTAPVDDSAKAKLEQDKPAFEVKDIQGDVGTARVKKLMDYMSAKQAEKKKAREARDKTFVSNHTTLKEHFGKGYTKGFYKCRYDGKTVIVEGKVTKWPEKVSYVDNLTSLNSLFEKHQRAKTLIRQLAEFEDKPDYKYLIEDACQQMAQMAMIPMAQSFEIAQADEHTFEVKCSQEMILIDELQKLLDQFGAKVNSLSLNKSDGNATSITLTVTVGEPTETTLPVAQGY